LKVDARELVLLPRAPDHIADEDRSSHAADDGGGGGLL
jgi:hypothetical protein